MITIILFMTIVGLATILGNSTPYTVTGGF